MLRMRDAGGKKQFGDILLDRCLVPEENRLPGVTSFAAATAALAASRLMIVAWQPVGMAMGVYDMCVAYLAGRQQFGAPLAAMQINQEKLIMRMLANAPPSYIGRGGAGDAGGSVSVAGVMRTGEVGAAVRRRGATSTACDRVRRLMSRCVGVIIRSRDVLA